VGPDMLAFLGSRLRIKSHSLGILRKDPRDILPATLLIPYKRIIRHDGPGVRKLNGATVLGTRGLVTEAAGVEVIGALLWIVVLIVGFSCLECGIA